MSDRKIMKCPHCKINSRVSLRVTRSVLSLEKYFVRTVHGVEKKEFYIVLSETQYENYLCDLSLTIAHKFFFQVSSNKLIPKWARTCYEKSGFGVHIFIVDNQRG